MSAARYALTRLRARLAVSLVALFVIALGTSFLLIVLALPALTGELALRRSIDELTPVDRGVTVVVAPEASLPEIELASIDRRLRARFANSGVGTLRRLVELRALAATDGSVFRLGGVDQFASGFRVVEGRAPKPCISTRCEVVAIDVDGLTSLSAALRRPTPDIVVVGRAVRLDPVAFTGAFAPERGETMLVANGAAGVGTIRSLELIRRVHGWVATLRSSALTRSGVQPFLRKLAAAGDDVDIAGYDVIAPDAAISEALARAGTASRTLALPAGSLATLVAFAVFLLGMTRGRAHQIARSRLARRGASRSALRSFDAVDTGALTLSGVTLGVGLAAAVVAVVAHRCSIPVVEVARQSMTPSIALGVLGLLAGQFLLLAAGVRAVRSPAQAVAAPRSRGVVQASDLVGVAAAFGLVLVVGRGESTMETLGRSADPVLWALPMLSAIVIGAVALRLVPLVMHLVQALFAGRSALSDVAVGDALTARVRPSAAAAMVSVATAFAMFGIGYRSTLVAGTAEQASFAVPFDATLSISNTLVRPDSVRPRGGWSSLDERVGSIVTATPVLRRSATVRRSGADSDVVDVLALDPRSVTAIRSWRPDYGPSPGRLATSLSVSALPPVGSVLPLTARQLSLRISGGGSEGVDEVKISVIVERVDGTWHEVVAEWTEPNRVTAVLEPTDRGGRFVGVRISQPPETAKRQEHNAGEGRGTAVEATGLALVIEAVDTLDSTGRVLAPVPFTQEALSSRAATTSLLAGGRLRVEFALQGTSALLVPRVDQDPIPALVDPLTAASAVEGVVVAQTQGASFEFRVVAQAVRFPTLADRFIVADIGRVGQRFNLAQPTYGTPGEVWLRAPGHDNALASELRRAPYDVLGLDLRRDRIRLVAEDPLVRTALTVLLASAVLAALLAALALTMNASGELADDEAFHRTLLLDGIRPRVVRRFVLIRTAAIGLAALPAGLLGGVVLLSITTAVVQISAEAIAPVPPIRVSAPLVVVSLALAGVAIALLAGSYVGSRLGRFRSGHDLLRGAS